MTSGVPHGSILGLFLIYVTDMPDIIETSPFMFADDTKLLSIHSGDDDSMLQQDPNRLEHWCTDTFMEFNVDKCHIVTFTNNNPIELYLYGQPLIPSKTEKHLGVYISDNLKWKQHIHGACHKANKVLNLIERNVGSQITSFHKLDLYKSMVLTYG